jgi:glycosyltransferase involved in cell wall biosynthesis
VEDRRWRSESMPLITGTIITFNEEGRIAEAIASLACCDEVLVVDSGSTDRTCQLAVQCGARVLTRAWEGYSKQKNFAAEQAKNDWILSLDADERLSVELCVAVSGWKRMNPAFAAMSMARRAFYLGKWIRHSGWYPDRKIRLYNRRQASWKGDFVHESMEVHGPLGFLQGDLLHFPYRSWQDQLDRIDRYTRLAADAARKAGKRGNPLKLLLAPPLFFIKALFLQAGLLDGWRGVLIGYMGARYVFLRELRMWR